MNKLEILYTTHFAPDPTRALDVLAFILSPTDAFCDGSCEARALLNAAKCEAAANWQRTRDARSR